MRPIANWALTISWLVVMYKNQYGKMKFDSFIKNIATRFMFDDFEARTL